MLGGASAAGGFAAHFGKFFPPLPVPAPLPPLFLLSRSLVPRGGARPPRRPKGRKGPRKSVGRFRLLPMRGAASSEEKLPCARKMPAFLRAFLAGARREGGEKTSIARGRRCAGCVLVRYCGGPLILVRRHNAPPSKRRRDVSLRLRLAVCGRLLSRLSLSLLRWAAYNVARTANSTAKAARCAVFAVLTIGCACSRAAHISQSIGYRR